MTVFSAHEKERLHGHNYFVSVEIDLAPKSPLIAFKEFKEPIRKLCQEWDERVLLAQNCPHLKLESTTPVRFTLCGKHYELPTEDVVMLPVDNVSSENLSRLFCEKLKAAYNGHVHPAAITRLAVTVSESDGQSVTCQDNDL